MTGPARARAALDRACSEADLLDAVRALAHLTGWRTYHTHDSRGSEPGFPDLVMVRGARLLVAELKTERGRVTPDQRAWLADLAAAGVEAHLWRPADWHEIAATLARRGDQP